MLREKSKRSSLLIFGMTAATVISKLLGLLRSSLFASVFGDSAGAAAFSAAAKIPSSVFDMMFSAAILGCFIPVYSRAASVGKDEARAFSSSFFTFTALLTSAASLVGLVFSGRIIALAAPFSDAETLSASASLLRIMFFMMLFTGLAYVLVGISQSNGMFILPSLISVFSNLLIIIYLAFFARYSGRNAIYILAVVYLASSFVQFLTLLIPLARKKLLPGISLDRKSPYMSKAFGMMPPVVFGSWLIPATALISNRFLSLYGSRFIVTFECADTLCLMSAGVFIYAFCNYMFPSVSAQAASGDTGYFATAEGVLYRLLSIIVPVSVLVYLLAPEAVCIIYMRGSFSPDAARSCAVFLKTLAFCMPAVAVNEVLSRVFYAGGTHGVPMLSAVCGIAAGIVSNRLFLPEGESRLVAVSYCVALWTSALVMISAYLIIKKRRRVSLFSARPRISGVCAALLASAAAVLVKHSLEGDAYENPFFENFIVCAIVFLSSVVIYFICIFLPVLLKRKRPGEPD